MTPHTLRHTAATWLAINKVPIWDAASYVGMSVQTHTNVYAHAHTTQLEEAAHSIGRGGRGRESMVQSVVVSLEQEREKRRSSA